MTTQRQDTETINDKALNIKPFNLVSSAQREVMVLFMKEVSGLHRDQFAVNSWGFPMIPIPQIRRTRSQVRTAPTNVSQQFLFHPIYWVDPQLTEFDSDRETEEQWSIRMFYLLLGFGYWNEQLQWIDYVQANSHLMKGEGYWDQGDIEAYHMLANPKTRFDAIGLLTEDDLLISMEEVEESFNFAITRCNKILQQEMGKMLHRQSEALKNSRALLGNDRLNDPDLSPDAVDGFWSQQIDGKLAHLCELYDTQFEMQTQNLGEITNDVYTSYQEVLDLILGIDAMIATLTIPVIRYAESMSDAYSYMTTYIAMANSQARERERGYPIMEMVGNALGENRGRGALTEVREYAYELYFTAWRRMRLAVFNYERMQDDLPPFENYTQLEAHLIEHQSEFRTKDREERARTFKDIDDMFG